MTETVKNNEGVNNPMKKAEIHYPEDGEWTQEDVEQFVHDVEEEDYEIKTGGNGGSDKPPVHPGAAMAGIVLFFLIVYSVYIGEIQFAGLNSALLTLLALGSKAIN